MATIYINESQLRLIKEFEDKKEVLYYQFESHVRDYLKELRKDAIHPKYDEFFVKNSIGENDLLNKMLDLGLISKKENIIEPENADGKKHSVHTKQYIFSNRNFNDNMHKLYDYFIKNSQLI
jgi:hypothetical protein